MRLIRVPSKSRDSIHLINTDLVTDVTIYPCPEDSAYYEVTVSFGENYMEVRYRDIGDARQLIADIAGVPLDSMMSMLTGVYYQ